ncbi:hypothetical protein ANOBCDAF_04641 [Pleomorphomonas sp. T1.2MG-36]|nr:DUF2474 domain-containing protein [Pleomorphomonas sp. T1.2MG-36]CAI9404553.1 hypothetical protein ANOBCDAF_04641 [Pleomorphomonas sp. T1.2MG-36]
MAGEKTTKGLWFRRVGWLVAIWAGSILALGVVAMAFRLLMNLAGMKS